MDKFWIMALITAVILPSCNAEQIRENQRQHRENELRQFRIKCATDYGFKWHSTEHKQCVQQLDQQNQQQRRAATQELFRDLGNTASNIGRPSTQPFPQQTIIVPGVATCHGHVCY